MAIACGKLGLVGTSKTRIGTFKPPSASDPALSEVVRRLSEVCQPVRICLFGSAARPRKAEKHFPNGKSRPGQFARLRKMRLSP